MSEDQVKELTAYINDRRLAYSGWEIGDATAMLVADAVVWLFEQGILEKK